MGYKARLERGGKYIDFDGTDLLYLGPDWKPPTINLVPSMTTGTSAASYSPAIKVSERVQSQDVSISFYIRGATSGAQINQQISRINTFLRDA